MSRDAVGLALVACEREDEADAVLADAIRWGVRGSVVRRLARTEQDRLGPVGVE